LVETYRYTPIPSIFKDWSATKILPTLPSLPLHPIYFRDTVPLCVQESPHLNTRLLAILPANHTHTKTCYCPFTCAGAPPPAHQSTGNPACLPHTNSCYCPFTCAGEPPPEHQATGNPACLPHTQAHATVPLPVQESPHLNTRLLVILPVYHTHKLVLLSLYLCRRAPPEHQANGNPACLPHTQTHATVPLPVQESPHLNTRLLVILPAYHTLRLMLLSLYLCRRAPT
jgi:hypothetical protein